MTNIPIERRSFPRFPFELPILINEIDGRRGFEGITRNVSRTGVFFYTCEQLPADSAVQFRMVMPAEIMLGQGRRIVARATVLRVQPSDSGIGVAVRIETDISA
jgi:hypothetical protein